MGTGALDGRADIYSVGVLLFQALTGRVPFTGTNDFDIMTAQVSTEPPRPSSLNPAIAPELERIVLKALAKKPSERFQDAKQFRTALEELKLPAGVAVHPAKTAPPVMAPRFALQTLSGGTPRIALVAALVCVAVALIVLFLIKMH
jgi:serine/threonine-protein kinase